MSYPKERARNGNKKKHFILLFISFFPLSAFKTLLTLGFISSINSLKSNIYIKVYKSTAYLAESTPRLQYFGQSVNAV